MMHSTPTTVAVAASIKPTITFTTFSAPSPSAVRSVDVGAGKTWLEAK